LSHLDGAKEKPDGANEFFVAKSTEDFHVIFESELVSDGFSDALDNHYNTPEDLYNARKYSVAQAAEHFRTWEQLFMCQFCFGAPVDDRCEPHVQGFAGEA